MLHLDLKIQFEKKHFFAEVRLTSKGKFCLYELEKSSQKRVKIQPVLIENIKINNNTSLANAISLYGSLFEERLKIKLEENFPEVNFENINHSTTLEQLIKEKPYGSF